MSASLPRVLAREPLPPDEAKWTKLVKVTYEDADGTARVWESAERTTRPPPRGEGEEAVDGVDIVAILRGRSGGNAGDVDATDQPHIILIKQFRPAVGRTVIELPAGLVDAGESAEDAARRELREETGYTGVVSRDSGDSGLSLPLFADPGFGNNNLQIIHMAVDRGNPANWDPKPELEDGELVQAVFTVPLAQLYAWCRELAAHGYAIDARVGTLAEGMEMARRYLSPK